MNCLDHGMHVNWNWGKRQDRLGDQHCNKTSNLISKGEKLNRNYYAYKY